LLTLLVEADGRAEELRRDLREAPAASWLVALDFDALAGIAGLDSSRFTAGRGTPVSGHHLGLPIPGRNVPLRLNIDTVYEGYGGVITYAGDIEGDDGSVVAISVDGNEVLGKIHHSEGFTYLIETSSKGQGYTLSLIDQTLIPRLPDQHEEENGSASGVREPVGSRPNEIAIQSLSSSGNVRLLVLYTPAVASQPHININLLANNIVSTFNQSLGLSGVNSSNYVTLAGVRSIGSNLAAINNRCRDEILDEDMGNRSGAFSSLDAWMEVAYADIALAIVTNEPSYAECNSILGRFGGRGLPIDQYPDHSSPFSVTTEVYALADLTAIHEVGHVLNGMHAAYNDCNWGQFPHLLAAMRPSIASGRR
jgi:hypothetical protein